ncbi:MAG TPA: hypothetical protein VIG25_20380 [Pyrinomonadaceae bacterium]|jgi:hypothetical protein
MKKQLLLLLNVFLVSVIVPLTNNQRVCAQSEAGEPLNREWVRNDVDGVAVLLKLTPIENQNIAFLKIQLKRSWSIEDEPLGFGANRVSFSKGYGYSSIHIDVLTYENQVAYYEIGISGSPDKWDEYREEIISTWQRNGGPEFTENGTGLTYHKKYEHLFDFYYRAVAAELGEVKSVNVPDTLKVAYDYLISPFNNSSVGEGICGLGGSILEGKTSIDALIQANRIDLILNVLRGYNPGGRIFAAIALTRMSQQGVALDAEIMTTLDRVLNLDVPASTCAGCIVSSGRRAKDIVAEFVKR